MEQQPNQGFQPEKQFNNPSSKTWQIAAIVAVGVLVIESIIFGSYYLWQKQTEKVGQKVCTQEAQQCPDGSYVSRTETNCEFAACPSVSPSVSPSASATPSATPDQTANWQTYTNKKAGYEIQYPINWPVVTKSESVNASDLTIKNSSNAVMPGSNSELRSNDSIISIQVAYGSISNGINYADYVIIEDIIKDPKFGTPPAGVPDELAKVSTMNIGGKDLRVKSVGNSNGAGMGYLFVYNGAVYNISFMSGSQSQFQKDLGTFNQMLSTFKFTK